MKPKLARLAPALIAVGVILLTCLVRLLQPEFFERLECMTYDVRVRQAALSQAEISTNLGFVDVNDASIAFVKTNQILGYRYGLYWPRSVYGRLIEELAAQHANAIAFDVIFGELRNDHPQVGMANGAYMESDDFFALQMRRAENVIIAADRDLRLPALFATNAAALGDISTDRDPDGVLRKARAFRVYSTWHWAFQQVAADPGFGIDLDRARVEPRQVLLPRSNGEVIKVPLDADGNFDLTDFGGDKLPPGVPRKAKPVTEHTIWHMGIVLAARQLGLDLTNARVDLPHGRITLTGPGRISRVIPVDHNGFFYIDWAITPTSPELEREPIRSILEQDEMRIKGATNLPAPWAGKLAVVGSSAVGNDLTDRGATPLERDTLLVGEHWNVANSLLTGRFIRRTSAEVDLALIVVLGAVSALLTWRLRALLASLLVALLTSGYVAAVSLLFVQLRWWIPAVLPVLGALLMTHICLVTWRVVFEQAERRRVKAIFSRIVSPNIVNELLLAEKLGLGGARREVTVLFADVRGFTEFTDVSQERAAAYAVEHQLGGAEAEAFFDAQARETLDTVNTYLSLVADQVKKHDGTLDKYIGDCVMAFWGAPTPNHRHALACVRAAIGAQRSIYELNCRRSEENVTREQRNAARIADGLPPLPPLPLLLLGSGINTGTATVGLMGSEAHISNYTVFGREVNLASRLESLSGQGRILVSESTFRHLLEEDPTLAATLVPLPDLQKVKGISTALKVYEVPWRNVPKTAPEISGPESAVKTEATPLVPRPNV